ncbi:MAG: hypothetical protein GY906_23625 [bacterium]|nr:hypothetical protein [bacterium]
MEQQQPPPAPEGQTLELWSEGIKKLLHEIGEELELPEGFEYAEIIPAIKALKSD